MQPFDDSKNIPSDVPQDSILPGSQLELTDDDTIAATLGDSTTLLPSDTISITITRAKDDDGEYYTDIHISRPVRRLYLIGLLQDTISLFTNTDAEYVYTPEPSELPDLTVDDGEDFDFDDDGEGERVS